MEKNKNEKNYYAKLHNLTKKIKKLNQNLH